MQTENMYKCVSFFLISFFLLFVFACKEKETLLPEHRGGQLFQGKIRMDIKCHGCHGWVGEGSMHAPALANDGSTISYFDFYSAVTYGRGGGMPAYHRIFSEKDMRLMMDWLQLVSILRSVK